MKIIPELDLSDDLEIAYSDGIHSWVEENLPGMRRINVQLFRKRNQYDAVAAIEFFSKEQRNSPTEKPKHDGKEIKVDDICEIMMKIVQFDCESKDQAGQYRFLITRTTPSGEKKVAKHFEPPSNEENEGRFIQNPAESETNEVLPTLMNYIRELHAVNLQNLGIVTGIIQPMQNQLTNLQNKYIELGQKSVEIARMQFTKDMYLYEKDIEKEVEKDRIKAGKEKIKSALDFLNKNQVLTMGVATMAHRMGVPIDKFLQVQQGAQQTQPPPQPESENKMTSEEEIDHGMKAYPLKTLCNLLGDTLQQEKRENLKDRLNDLEENIWSDFEILMNSKTEKEARGNYKVLEQRLENIDKMKFFEVLNELEEPHQKLIVAIFNEGNKK